MRNLTIAKRLARKVDSLSELCTLGFQKIEVKDSSIGYIYVNKDLGVVVKTSNIVGEPPPKKYRAPTEWFPKKFGRYGCTRIIVQALVDLQFQGDAYDKLRAEYKTSDLRISNVGWYRGRPVYHDW